MFSFVERGEPKSGSKFDFSFSDPFGEKKTEEKKIFLDEINEEERKKMINEIEFPTHYSCNFVLRFPNSIYLDIEKVNFLERQEIEKEIEKGPGIIETLTGQVEHKVQEFRKFLMKKVENFRKYVEENEIVLKNKVEILKKFDKIEVDKKRTKTVNFSALYNQLFQNCEDVIEIIFSFLSLKEILKNFSTVCWSFYKIIKNKLNANVELSYNQIKNHPMFLILSKYKICSLDMKDVSTNEKFLERNFKKVHKIIEKNCGNLTSLKLLKSFSVEYPRKWRSYRLSPIRDNEEIVLEEYEKLGKIIDKCKNVRVLVLQTYLGMKYDFKSLRKLILYPRVLIQKPENLLQYFRRSNSLECLKIKNYSMNNINDIISKNGPELLESIVCCNNLKVFHFPWELFVKFLEEDYKKMDKSKLSFLMGLKVILVERWSSIHRKDEFLLEFLSKFVNTKICVTFKSVLIDEEINDIIKFKNIEIRCTINNHFSFGSTFFKKVDFASGRCEKVIFSVTGNTVSDFKNLESIANSFKSEIRNISIEGITFNNDIIETLFKLLAESKSCVGVKFVFQGSSSNWLDLEEEISGRFFGIIKKFLETNDTSVREIEIDFVRNSWDFDFVKVGKFRKEMEFSKKFWKFLEDNVKNVKKRMAIVFSNEKRIIE